MSMPGFVFHFRCDSCGITSDEYSIFPFQDIFRPDMQLPTWSVPNQCWGHVHLSLNQGQRKTLESNHETLVEFAASMSTSALTVCVPRLSGAEHLGVSITPSPVCPKCQQSCEAVVGHPPHECQLEISDIPIEEIDAAPLTSIEISVRTLNICSMLGIRTIGQLRQQRDNVTQHDRASDSTRVEVDRWFSLGTEPRKAT